MPKKEIANWQDALLKVACAHESVGMEFSGRTSGWAKFINGVDERQKNGYAFLGDFIKDGTTELVIKPRIFLTKISDIGKEYYNVILMDASGTLTVTDVHTAGPERGWALRIRSDVARLVARTRLEAEGLTARPQARSRTVTLSGAALEHLEALEEIFTGASNDTIIEAALVAYLDFAEKR